MGTSRLVQSTIVLPVIGYILIFSERFLDYYRLVIDPQGTEPLLWRLYLLYFGFCCFALASALFSWRCPEIIKGNESASRYADLTARTITERHASEIREWIIQQAPLDQQVDVDGETSELNYEQILLRYFVLTKRAYPISRIIVRTLYDIGWVLVLFPALHVFMAVWARAWPMFVGWLGSW